MRTKKDLLCLSRLSLDSYKEPGDKDRKIYDGDNDHGCADKIPRFREHGWVEEDSLYLTDKGQEIADAVEYLRNGAGTDLISDIGVPNTIDFASLEKPQIGFQAIQRLKEFGYIAQEDYMVSTNFNSSITVKFDNEEDGRDAMDVLKPAFDVDYARDERYLGNHSPKKLKVKTV